MISYRAISRRQFVRGGAPIGAEGHESRLRGVSSNVAFVRQPRTGPRAMRRQRSGEGRVPRRETDAEMRAAALAIRDLDRAVVALDDPFRDRQPEPGAAGRRAGGPPEPIEDVRQVLGLTPGPSSSTSRSAERPSRRTATRTWPPRRAVPDRVVDEDHDELAEPGGVALDRRRLRVDLDAHACAAAGLARAAAASAATSPRSSGSRSSVTAPESDRARRSRSSTSEVRWSTSASMSSSASPTSLTGSSALRRRCSTELRMTVSGVRSSWLASAANSRWRRSASALGGEGVADRHERPARVDGSEAHRDEDDDGPADEEHREDRVRVCCLGRPVLDRPGRRTGPMSVSSGSVSCRTGRRLRP